MASNYALALILTDRHCTRLGVLDICIGVLDICIFVLDFFIVGLFNAIVRSFVRRFVAVVFD